jgi:uncharacterized protein (TIGR02301 family)
MVRLPRAALLAFCLVLALPAARSLGQEPDVEPEPDRTETGEAAAAVPAPTELPPPIYEDKLLRLSEILGALSFLRRLCGEKDASVWRDEMSALLAAEQPGPRRRSRLVGRFNHGFETFNAVYRACTPSARLAIARYLDEGKALSNDVRSRYSQ